MKSLEAVLTLLVSFPFPAAGLASVSAKPASRSPTAVFLDASGSTIDGAATASPASNATAHTLLHRSSASIHGGTLVLNVEQKDSSSLVSRPELLAKPPSLARRYLNRSRDAAGSQIWDLAARAGAGSLQPEQGHQDLDLTADAPALDRQQLELGHQHVDLAVGRQSQTASGGSRLELVQDRARARQSHSPESPERVGDCRARLRVMKEELKRRGLTKSLEEDLWVPDEDVGYLPGLANKEIARLDKPQGSAVVCQTGFNLGISAFALLCGTSAKVVSWDFGRAPLAKSAESLIQKFFPGRHTLIVDDSSRAMSGLQQQCDVVFANGAHTAEVATVDIINFARLARPQALLVVDKCMEKARRSKARAQLPKYVTSVGVAFDAAVSRAEIEKYPAESKEDQSVCLGRYRNVGAAQHIFYMAQNVCAALASGASSVESVANRPLIWSVSGVLVLCWLCAKDILALLRTSLVRERTSDVAQDRVSARRKPHPSQLSAIDDPRPLVIARGAHV